MSFAPAEPPILALPPKRTALRYRDVFFFTCKSGTSCARRVGAILISGSRAATTRGVGIGDPLERAQRTYGLKCASTKLGGDLAEHRYCSGRTGPGVLSYFGGDPIDDIEIALAPFPRGG